MFLSPSCNKKPPPSHWPSVRSAGRGFMQGKLLVYTNETESFCQRPGDKNRASAASESTKGSRLCVSARMPRLTTRIAADDPTRNWALLFLHMRRELSSRSETGGRRIRLTADEAASHRQGYYSIANVPDLRPTHLQQDIVLLIRRVSTPLRDRINYELFVNERSAIAYRVKNSPRAAITR